MIEVCIGGAFYKKGGLGRFLIFMRPFHHSALRTSHYALFLQGAENYVI